MKFHQAQLFRLYLQKLSLIFSCYHRGINPSYYPYSTILQLCFLSLLDKGKQFLSDCPYWYLPVLVLKNSLAISRFFLRVVMRS